MTAPTLAPSRGRARPATILFSVAVIALALWTVWRLTPRGASTAAAPAGHQHGAAAAADSARSVQLGDADQRRIGITFAAVTTGPLTRGVRVVGQVTLDETRVTAIAPRVDGWVERLEADFTGQSVRAGAPLLTLYAPMVVSAEEELLVALRLEAAVVDATPEARERAGRLVHAARRRLAAWAIPDGVIAQVERTGVAPRTLTLRAPVSGVVIEKNVLDGQRVMAGDVLYRIADLSVVWLEGEVFEQDLGAARIGQAVTAEFQALPGEPRTGRITYVYPTLDPQTRTGRIRVAFANPRLELKPGMFATIRFDTRATGPVLSVPRSAVLSTGARNLVFLKRPDGMFTPTDVQLGAQTEDRLEILHGLSAGDTVVASATFLLDAESNLGTLLGGMGDMPGMDLTAPDTSAPGTPMRAPTPTPVPAAPAPADSSHTGHTGHGE